MPQDMEEYDYIVAGGGTAGCVVAARLAEDPNVRVLLIEAGEHNRDLETVHSAGQYAKNFEGPNSWNIKSVPMPSCNNRKVPLHRGRFLGGSSGANTCFAIRGTKHDYDDWNLPGWSGEEFFAAMRKCETFHSKDWFQHDPKAHGTEGPVNIEPHDIAPITDLMLESYHSYGLPLHPDMFSTGEHVNGCGHALRTIYKGQRSTGADYVTNDRQKSNIETLTNTLVDKVTLERTEDGGLRAVGVELRDEVDTRLTVRARREVVVSGGAYCSPTILMRSGIGPREELQKHGIECTVDRPGVGQNLEDHVIAFIPYEVSKPRLTTDHLSWHGNAAAENLANYTKDKNTFLGTMPFGAFAYARLDERLKDSSLWQEARSSAPPGRDPMGLSPQQPNIEIFHTECAPAGFEPEGGEASIFCTVVELFGPRSARMS